MTETVRQKAEQWVAHESGSRHYRDNPSTGEFEPYFNERSHIQCECRAAYEAGYRECVEEFRARLVKDWQLSAGNEQKSAESSRKSVNSDGFNWD